MVNGMADWMNEQRDAHGDLLEEGVVFTFTRETKGAFDPVRGAYGPGETLVFTAPGIMKPFHSGGNKAAQVWRDASLIESGDEVLLIGCGGLLPELEDRVDIGGAAWAVKGVSVLRPGLVPLLANVLIRRA